MKIQQSDYEQIMSWVNDDRDEIVSFLSRLVQCKTPSTVGDTREAVKLVAGFLDANGIAHEELACCKTMPNVISSFEGARAGRHLMLNGHLDVMPAGKEPGWTCDPWGGVVQDGRVWGRGTSDMKAGDTAMLFAYKYLHRMRDRLAGRLSITLVADEETGWGRGTGYLFDVIPGRMAADCVLTGEPSGMGAISFASKGYMALSAKVRTRGAIAGYSNESENAIEIAANVIRELKRLEGIEVQLPEELESLLSDEEWRAAHSAVRGEGEAAQLKRITVDVCTIKGGSMTGVIPSECSFTASVVFPQGTNVSLLEDQVAEIFQKHEGVTLSIEGVDLPEMSDRNGELPKIIQAAAKKVGLSEPILTPDIALSDCRYWRYWGVPAYWYGPGGEDCSAANESILVDDLLNTVRIHTITAFEFLQP